jgi:hypothetical protein
MVVWALTLIGFGPPDDENGAYEERGYFYDDWLALPQQFRYSTARHIGVARRLAGATSSVIPCMNNREFANFGVGTNVKSCFYQSP